MQDKKNKQSPLGLINTEDSSCWNAFLGDSHIFQKKLEHCEHCHIHFVFLILFQSISFFQHFLNMTSLPDADLCILRIAFSESWPLHPYDPKLHLLQRMHHEFIYIYIYIYLNCLKWYFNDICMLLGHFLSHFLLFFFLDLLKGSCSFQQSTGLQDLVISFHLRPNSSTISGNSYCANAG